MGPAFAKDGSLLMPDDASGSIYRISYKGPNPGHQAKLAVPAESMNCQARKGFDVPIALKRPKTETKGKLEVKSAAFDDSGTMDKRYETSRHLPEG